MKNSQKGSLAIFSGGVLDQEAQLFGKIDILDQFTEVQELEV